MYLKIKYKDIFHKGFRIASLRFYEAIDANFDQVIYLSSANRRVWTNKKIQKNEEKTLFTKLKQIGIEFRHE